MEFAMSLTTHVDLHSMQMISTSNFTRALKYFTKIVRFYRYMYNGSCDRKDIAICPCFSAFEKDGGQNKKVPDIK